MPLDATPLLPLPLTADELTADWFTTALAASFPGSRVESARVDLLPRLPMNAPRCWFAASDAGSHQSIVMMDDLDARGVRFCRAQQAHTFDQAWSDYRRELVYGLFIFLINETRFQSEAVNTAYAARFGAAVAQHRSFERLLGDA